ncbi:MAG: chromate transporter [Bacteroidales bacterium]|nr:chromate transporter [Bacteroidales bacterium]
MYRQLFLSFWKIGAFTIGGGYVMIPIMEQELVDRRGWLSREEFLDYMSLSQAMPGVFAVNMATCVGRRLGGMKGVVCAVLGNILMPIALILLLAIFFRFFRDNVIVDRVFMGLRPAVVALIAAPVFRLAKSAKLSWSTIWIPVVAALLIWLLGVSPIWIVLAAIAGGLLWGFIKNRHDSSQSSNVSPSR